MAALISQHPQQGHVQSALRQVDPGYPDRVQHVLQGVESTTIRVGKYKIRFGKGERCLHCALQESNAPKQQYTLSSLLICPAGSGQCIKRHMVVQMRTNTWAAPLMVSKLSFCWC